jgi:hypothetical protein
LVKRRLTPPNRSKPLAMVSSDMPSSAATPIAASAFETLWRPGIGKEMSRIVRTLPERSRIVTSKRLPPGTGRTFSPRTSASAAKPYGTTRRSRSRGMMVCTSGWSTQSRAAP